MRKGCVTKIRPGGRGLLDTGENLAFASRRPRFKLLPELGEGHDQRWPFTQGEERNNDMQLMKRQLWDPFRDSELLNERFNRMLGFLRPSENGDREALTVTAWSPAVDISETDKEYRIGAELPNVSKDNVHVTLDAGVLTIQGDRKEEMEEKGERFHRRELSYGHFLRSFSMPADADEDKVNATFKDGMLNVTIGKTKARAPKAKQIAIS